MHGHCQLLRWRHEVVAHVRGGAAAGPALETVVHCTVYLRLMLLQQVEVRLLLQMAVIDVFAVRHGGVLVLRGLLLLQLLAIDHALGRRRD